MGVFFTTISEFFFAKPNIEFRISVIGFENSGKTTILQRVKLSDYHQVMTETVPTIGMNLEELTVKNVNLKVWDLSG
jgi:GTPase SAR1 family protein